MERSNTHPYTQDEDEDDTYKEIIGKIVICRGREMKFRPSTRIDECEGCAGVCEDCESLLICEPCDEEEEEEDDSDEDDDYGIGWSPGWCWNGSKWKWDGDMNKKTSEPTGKPPSEYWEDDDVDSVS